MTYTEYLLVLLMEECAEVQHRASKALRFGLDEVQDGQPHDNRDRLSFELADLRAIVHLLTEDNSVNPQISNCDDMVRDKIKKVECWMVLSRQKGVLPTE